MSAGTRHYGAKWWKFDFHNHTPKSDDYGKGPNQIALKARSPREWLLDFMNAGMDCVAITDHNSGEWIDPLKEELFRLDAEKPAGYRPLTLFPGVEISVNGGIHILALFDPGVSGSKIISLLSKCDYEGQPGKTDHCTRSSCADVIELIQQEGGIPILAHADADSGLTHNPNIPVNGAAEQIVEMRFVMGQIRTGSMGALQRQEIRRAVCEVMEGGKEALDKRYYRISRALS